MVCGEGGVREVEHAEAGEEGEVVPQKGEGVGLGGEEGGVVREVEPAEVRDCGEGGEEGLQGGGGEVAGGEVEGVEGGEFVEGGGDDVDIILRGLERKRKRSGITYLDIVPADI